MKDTNYMSIPKEKFAFANTGDKIHDAKFEDKPIGYFKDAWLRFKKNKASIIAAFIIILIVLFSIFVPVFNSRYDSTFLDPYYAKKAPKSPWLSENLGIVNGTTSRDASARGVFWLAATGVGAAHTKDVVASGESVTIAEGMENEFSPIHKYKFWKVGPDGKDRFSLKVDVYNEVGFRYVQVSQSELAKIEAWQTENGIQVIYPLIADNEYTYYPIKVDDANYWYKTNQRGDPITLVTDNYGEVKEKTLKLSDDVVLEDNYLRDENGNLVYSVATGGGDAETSARRIRVLYHNYYVYKNGFEPSYIFGTDSQGYDLALRMADGIRLSLIISVLVSAVNFVIGAIWGAVAGYYGGAIDLTMERITDILAGIPSIVVMSLFQIHFAQKVGVIPSLLFAFVLTGWIGMSSRVRTQFYRFKNQEYVMAARTLGARDRRIIWKHIFPNTLGTIITGSVLAIPGVIFTESMLSFLGIVNLGGSKTTSLGTLLSDASSIWTNFPHLMLFPAIIISLLMVSFNLFGNGLRDAFNPSLRGVED